MSINVVIIGGSLMVQHYVETLGRKDHLILDSESDVFLRRANALHVTWEFCVDRPLFAASIEQAALKV